MGRMTLEKRRDARERTDKIALAYQQVVAELMLGNVSVHEIGRGNLYKRIAQKTGMSIKAIAYKMNHCV